MQSKALFDQLRQKAPLVSVGVLSADLMSLGSDLELLERAGVELLHFDIMDGCFCPMMTVGPGFVKAVKTTLLKDVHLMIDEPLDKLESYVAAGADMITVHVESCRHTHRVLQSLGEMTNTNDSARGILRGIALNPGTPIETVMPLLDEVQMVFLLAVNPGWGGQKFIASAQRRLKQLEEMIAASGRDILTGVDGGITQDNIADVARMGADIIVTGSAVFRGNTALENAKSMMRTAENAAKSINTNAT
ncbi:MAG: ribulose-phosphate 3-epimerase [Phycisphaerae bacterium]|nr:ribulose-phosphate 3-epimerase [Phycisphaerae bacterium]